MKYDRRTFVDIVDPVLPNNVCPREGGMFGEAPTDAGACVAHACGWRQLNLWWIICHGRRRRRGHLAWRHELKGRELKGQCQRRRQCRRR